MTSIGLSEKQIENSILNWLKSKRILAFKIKSVGTYDPRTKKFRAPSPLYRKGVSDILGIFKGRPLAIEVKSAKGRLNEHQKSFLSDFKEHGGITIVARSIEDVESELFKAERVGA